MRALVPTKSTFVFWVAFFLCGCFTQNLTISSRTDLDAVFQKEIRAQTSFNTASILLVEARIKWQRALHESKEANLVYLDKLYLAVEAKRALRLGAEDPKTSVSAMDSLVSHSKNATFVKRGARKVKDDKTKEAEKLELGYKRAHSNWKAAEINLKNVVAERLGIENATENSLALRTKTIVDRVNEAKRNLALVFPAYAPTNAPTTSVPTTTTTTTTTTPQTLPSTSTAPPATGTPPISTSRPQSRFKRNVNDKSARRSKDELLEDSFPSNYQESEEEESIPKRISRKKRFHSNKKFKSARRDYSDSVTKESEVESLEPGEVVIPAEIFQLGD